MSKEFKTISEVLRYYFKPNITKDIIEELPYQALNRGEYHLETSIIQLAEEKIENLLKEIL